MYTQNRIFLSLIVGASYTGCIVARDAPPGKPGNYALLVGCTRYPNLKTAYQLRGPSNDVLLMRDLLVERFGFSADNIVVLSEEAGDDNRPTKERIRQAFKHLAKVAGKGDRVVIHLSGHGSQQPQKEPDDPESYEPDGLSEIFLPADVASWDEGKKEVANAIVDVELRGWLKAIRAKGASLVLIVDACHAGGMCRGSERFRQVPPDELVPPAALQQAAQKARQRYGTARGESTKSSPFTLSRFAPALAAIYASQPTEPTIEDKFPLSSADAKPYGLLTYTLVQVVRQATEPLTYRELVQRIHARYVGLGRYFPTPLVEGKDQDREFLGQREWPGRSRILVKKDAEEDRAVNAGSIHGLTVGSILAVYPPVGEPGGKTKVGHARVNRLRAIDAQIEPCAYADLPAPRDLPIGGRCEVVFTACDNQRLRVALDDTAVRDKNAPPDWQRLGRELDKLDKEPHSLVQRIQNPADADWLLCVVDGQVVLNSAASVANSRDAARTKPFGPVPFDDRLGTWLGESLNTIARARNLLALATVASAERGDADNGTDIKVELLRYRANRSDAAFDVVEWSGRGRELRKGDTIGFRIANRGRYAVDVSLLFVDSDSGIAAFFPEEGAIADNRVRPGESRLTPRGVVNVRTTGLEHMVVIAVKVKSDEQPMDFSFLAQPSLHKARLKAPSQRTRGLDSPLGLLFQHAVFREGNTRGLTREINNDYAVSILSWTSSPTASNHIPAPVAPKQTTPVETPDSPPGSANPTPSALPSQEPRKEGLWTWLPYIGGSLVLVVALLAWLRIRLRAGQAF